MWRLEFFSSILFPKVVVIGLKSGRRWANLVRIPGSARIFFLFRLKLQIREIDRVRLIGIILFKPVSVHNKFLIVVAQNNFSIVLTFELSNSMGSRPFGSQFGISVQEIGLIQKN